MKTRALTQKLTATTIPVSDYAVGSTESRAAARALLEKKMRIREDRDALLIFRHAEDCDPDLRMMVESTHIYARGRDLYTRSHGDSQVRSESHSSWSAASSAFRLAYGREPRRGDVLRFEDLEAVYVVYLGLIEQFIEAWGRHLSPWICPLRIDGALVLIQRRSEWVKKEAGLAAPGEAWARIQTEVYGDLPVSNGKYNRHRKSRAKAIVFAGMKIGKARWDPASHSSGHCLPLETNSGILGILEQVIRRLGLN